MECFFRPYFCKVLLFVLKYFIQAFFIKFHWTQHVFENVFKNDNDATLPVWKKEKSSKTDARAVCNCNFKKSLHSDNVHYCRTTVCSNARHVNVSPRWMFSISLTQTEGHGQLCALGVARCQRSVKLNSIGLFCLLLDFSAFHSAQMSPNDP